MTDMISWSALTGFRRECFERFGSITRLRFIQEPYALFRTYTHPDATVLDVGSGVDLPLKAHIQREHYYSLEPDPRAQSDFRHTNDIPGDLHFDLAWSNQVLEHVTIAEAMEIVSGVYRVLKPGGYYISTVPNVAHPVRYWADSTHKTHWSIGDYYGLFRMNDYSVVDYVRYGKVDLPSNPIKRFIVQTVSEAYRIDWADSIAIVAQKPLT
jgi:SAM-dependent methyltransferase